MTVYLDCVFFINTAIDYLLLLCTALIIGKEPERIRYGIAAAFGGLYAAAVYLPKLFLLTNPLVKLSVGAAMGLLAYGRGWRPIFLLNLLSATLAGILYALHRYWYGVYNAKALLAAAALFTAFVFLLFRGGVHRREQKIAVTVTLSGKTIRMTALHDTGNTLCDPTGRPVLIITRAAAARLFPINCTQELFTELCRRYPDNSCLLLPYTTISGQGLLPAIRCDFIEVQGRAYERLYVAVTDHEFSGKVQALWGGETEKEGAYETVHILAEAALAAAKKKHLLHWGK